LMLPDPTRRDVVHGIGRAGAQGPLRYAFQRMETEHVLRGIVEHHSQIGKIDEAVQPLGQIVEQVGQISPRGDDPRYVVQHEALLGGKMRGRVHSGSPSAQGLPPGLSLLYRVRNATVTGSRAAWMAGRSPPAMPMISAHKRPCTSRLDVTRKSNATCENVLKLSVDREAPSQ